MGEREASHGDNYTDWVALDKGIDYRSLRTEAAAQLPAAPEGSGVPDAASVPCGDAVARLATIVDEQATELENVRGLLRRVEESNTDLAFKLQFVLDRTKVDDGVYMFPDGDLWNAGSLA